LSFYFQFEGQTDYVTVPLSTFAVDNTAEGKCEMYIVSIANSAHPGAIANDTVVLGSLFLQQFVAMWNYTYEDSNSDIVSVDLTLALSDTYSFGSYIGSD
jgi:hypothetical protein